MAVGGIVLSTNAFSGNTTTSYKVIVKQLDLCTDWACTTPFNMFTGSKDAAVSTSGVAAGSDIDIKTPTSGSNYNKLRMKISTTFKLDAYGDATVPADSAVGNAGDTRYCASNSTNQYTSSVLAKAAAAEASVVMPVSGFFGSGNGVDSAGAIFYGKTTSMQAELEALGYTSKGDGNSSSENDYSMVLKQDTLGDDTFYITTVMKGDFDWGSGAIPTMVDFGITISSGGGSGSQVCGDTSISMGMCSAGTSGNCSIYPDEPVFDFTIQ